MPKYQAPTAEELSLIEKELQDLGIRVEDYQADAGAFKTFQAAIIFRSIIMGVLIVVSGMKNSSSILLPLNYWV